MVATTGPAAPIPSPAIAASDRLKRPAAPTEAQAEALAHLEAIRRGMQEAPKKAAAARVTFLKDKLVALKLAAGSAMATGDPRSAAATIRETRSLLKDLAKALKDAGLPDEAGRPGHPALGRAAAEKPVAAEAAPELAEVTQAREDARGVLKELKKVVGKLRIALLAAQVRGAEPNVIKQAERDLRTVEKELAAMSGDALGFKGATGHRIDLRA